MPSCSRCVHREAESLSAFAAVTNIQIAEVLFTHAMDTSYMGITKFTHISVPVGIKFIFQPGQKKKKRKE